MKHKAHMNRFTALNTALTVSFAAFGLFAVSAASAENYISISSDVGVQRPNYNNDGATDRFGMAIGVNTKATGHSGCWYSIQCGWCCRYRFWSRCASSW